MCLLEESSKPKNKKLKKEMLSLLEYKATEINNSGNVVIITGSENKKKKVKDHYRSIYKDYRLNVLYPKEIKKRSYSTGKLLQAVGKLIITSMDELSIDDLTYIKTIASPTLAKRMNENAIII